ncbi:MAG: tetratricopeptide repeat protein [Candidatus Omnitrophica bacterium]|nr:tetratricopeptide repeat protein [Candidatus Omnitrophota bacterium]MBI2495153.1 tetratricopeptide repeat protein [Candidatus Omnitrophota bacterium]MBI3021110.1 tetratricopeptide repeat protein [Candidatus Omnitrophota bacterium]MBI3083116.1 tetratricopeptide repeat protein [Candidatus Omnitrophota bacterium]
MPRRSKSDELLDFEIHFYEKLLSAYPDFVDVLIPLGHAYTRRGLYEKGLGIDLRLTRLREHEPLTWYNLACSYSRLNRIDESLEALRRAFELGYRDVNYLQKDPDLLNLRQSTKYRQFLSSFSPPPVTSKPTP